MQVFQTYPGRLEQPNLFINLSTFTTITQVQPLTELPEFLQISLDGLF